MRVLSRRGCVATIPSMSPRSRARCAMAFITTRSSGAGIGTTTPATRRRLARAISSCSNGSRPRLTSTSMPLGSWRSRSTRLRRANATASGRRARMPWAARAARKSSHASSSTRTSASMSPVTRGEQRHEAGAVSHAWPAAGATTDGERPHPPPRAAASHRGREPMPSARPASSGGPPSISGGAPPTPRARRAATACGTLPLARESRADDSERRTGRQTPYPARRLPAGDADRRSYQCSGGKIRSCDVPARVPWSCAKPENGCGFRVGCSRRVCSRRRGRGASGCATG